MLPSSQCALVEVTTTSWYSSVWRHENLAWLGAMYRLLHAFVLALSLPAATAMEPFALLATQVCCTQAKDFDSQHVLFHLFCRLFGKQALCPKFRLTMMCLFMDQRRKLND